MKKKIVGIFVVMLLIAATVLPAAGTMNEIKDKMVSSTHEDNFSKLRESRLQDFQKDLTITTESSIYHTYQEMTDLLQDLEDNHSDIMSLTSLGKTYEEREIWMVKLSDNVDEDENEPEVLLMGAHHGNEKPSYEVLIYFIQHIVENYSKENTDDDGDGLINEDLIDGVDNDEDGLIDEDPSEDRVREVTNNTEIYIIPMFNPDGVEAGTRKNRAPNYGPFGFSREITSYGVDLNRNYGYRWNFIWFFLFLFPKYYGGATSYRDGSIVYRGERPFCEAETKTIKQLVDAHDFEICLTYHTYGKLILYPWAYIILPAKDKQLFESIGEDIKKINNYTLGQGVYLYPTIGDACDWLYGRKGIIPYTIELGTSYAPGDPEVVKEMCITHVGVNLYVCEKAESIKIEKIRIE